MEDKKQTEQKIIDVSIKLFAKNGFEGTSTRDICKEAGVNISLISYYFGGKKELYETVINQITEKIFNYMKSRMKVNFDVEKILLLPKIIKIQAIYKALEHIIDCFYSGVLSDDEINLLYREQMTSQVPINKEGFILFKKLLASILNKDENDKEIIFRTISIIGQVHSAKLFRQFSLDMMGQSGYSKEDIQMLKQIIMGQVKTILKSLGA